MTVTRGETPGRYDPPQVPAAGGMDIHHINTGEGNATLLVLPAIFTLFQNRAKTASPSLDPDDPTSAHYTAAAAAIEGT